MDVADTFDPPSIPPPPPPTWSAAAPLEVEPYRPGELTNVWRVILVLAFVFVVLAWSSVWNASVQLGQPTWWLGTRASPTSPIVRLIPFAGPALVALGAIANTRWLAFGAIGSALVLGGYGVFDLGRPGNLGWLEVAIAGAALVVSLASLTGTHRPARTAAAGR